MKLNSGREEVSEGKRGCKGETGVMSTRDMNILAPARVRGRSVPGRRDKASVPWKLR